MDELDKKINKCPFCGSTASFRIGSEHSYMGGYDITLTLECDYCPAEMTTYYGVKGKVETTLEQAKEYLIENWNSRK